MLVRKPFFCAVLEYVITSERGLDQILEFSDNSVVWRSSKITSAVPSES
jgi:hypothetical protein